MERCLILLFAEIYRLVYSFLVAHAHEKAAKAVRKAAKRVSIKEIKNTPNTSLENVLREWQQNKKDVESLKAEVQALTEKLAGMRAQSTASRLEVSLSPRSESASSEGSASKNP